MKDIATLAIPATTLCRLLQYADAHQAELSAGELAALAIEEWLARTEGGNVPCIRLHGYQWKTVFLPEGTQLRAWNRSGFAYAEVIGDSIVHFGDAVSPHEFIAAAKAYLAAPGQKYRCCSRARITGSELMSIAVSWPVPQRGKLPERQYPRHRLPTSLCQSSRACCHRPCNAFLEYRRFRRKLAFSPMFTQ